MKRVSPSAIVATAALAIVFHFLLGEWSGMIFMLAPMIQIDVDDTDD